MEYKTFKFELSSAETKSSASGDNFGVISGYASTFGNVDRGGDVVVQGAFAQCLERKRAEAAILPMYLQHSSLDIIGGFDTTKMYEDTNGLYVEGNINLNVSKGKDAYALIKQKVISSMSIGYTVPHEGYELVKIGDDFARKLKSVDLWEISAVTIPMNAQARITAVKSESVFPVASISELIKIISDENIEISSKKSSLSQLLRKKTLSRTAADFICRNLFKSANDASCCKDAEFATKDDSEILSNSMNEIGKEFNNILKLLRK